MLEWAGHALGIMQGPRTRGRKPAGMDEVEIELQQAVVVKLRGKGTDAPHRVTGL